MGQPMRLKLTREGLQAWLANHYTTWGAWNIVVIKRKNVESLLFSFRIIIHKYTRVVSSFYSNSEKIFVNSIYPYYMRVVRWWLLEINDMELFLSNFRIIIGKRVGIWSLFFLEWKVESLLLKFRLVIRKHYLPILFSGCKIAIIKNIERRVTFIKI